MNSRNEMMFEKGFNLFKYPFPSKKKKKQVVDPKLMTKNSNYTNIQYGYT